MSHPTIPGYTFDACRGSGAFGSVWRALWNGEFECAVKVLTPGTWHPQYLSWCLERLRREGERPGLMRIYSYDLGSDPPHLTMALLPEGSLTIEQLSGRLPAQESWTLLDSLAASLGWLHSEGIVHTGLSGGNVFVCPVPGGEPQVVLCDVGQGWLTGAPLARLHGQIGFIAPEHWRGAMQLLQEGRARGRDVYAFGVIAWRLLTGQWPRGEKVFAAIAASHSEDLKLDTESFAAWLEKQPPPEWPAEAASPEEAARRLVVEQCLTLNAADRLPDMQAVQQALAALALPPLPGAPVEAMPPLPEEVPPLPAETETELMTETVPEPESSLTPEAAIREDAPIFEERLPELEGGTEEAFAEDAQAPKKRRFSLSLPRLSLSLQRSRDEARPWWQHLLGPGAAGFFLLSTIGVTAWAFKERGGRKSLLEERTGAGEKIGDLESRLPRLEADLSNARSEASAARAEQAASARHRSVELISKLLATKPVEDSQLEGWRAALKAVAEDSAKVLENAPADAQGMEARWQLASLHHALGNAEATLPLLESLARDLDAAAIAAGGDFPAEQVRLTGRVEALTGGILHAQGRMEDALPHLRKAAESLEKWSTANPDDAATVRLYAQSLLLEGLALEDRAQYDQAKESLIRISGLINLPADDVNALAEERFIDSDAKFALSRLRKVEAGKAKPEEIGGILNEAFQIQVEAQGLLLTYLGQNQKSIPCRIRLSRGYAEMGRTSAQLQKLEPSNHYVQDAKTAYKESVEIYTELLKEMPDELSFVRDLAGLFADIADLHRITKGASDGYAEALEYQEAAVKNFRDLNVASPLNNALRRHLGTALVTLGSLKKDAGKVPDAVTHLREALVLLDDLLAESSLTEKDRRLCRLTSARARTSLAAIYEKMGNKRSESIAELTQAYADWTSSPIEDPEDQKKLNWVTETLKKLKP